MELVLVLVHIFADPALRRYLNKSIFWGEEQLCSWLTWGRHHPCKCRWPQTALEYCKPQRGYHGDSCGQQQPPVIFQKQTDTLMWECQRPSASIFAGSPACQMHLLCNLGLILSEWKMNFIKSVERFAWVPSPAKLNVLISPTLENAGSMKQKQQRVCT